ELESVMMEDVYSRKPKSEPVRAAEERYAYYRRCQGCKRDGEQCKNPALREGQLCYQHQAQAELKTRWERQKRALNLPPVTSFDNLQRAISIMARAVVENRIDLKVAGRLANAFWLAGKLLRLQARMAKTAKVASRMTEDITLETQPVAGTIAVVPAKDASRPCRTFGVRLRRRAKRLQQRDEHFRLRITSLRFQMGKGG